MSAGSLSFLLEPMLVDQMMSDRARGILACVSIPLVKENSGVGHKLSKGSAVSCWDSHLLWPQEHVAFPGPLPEKC